MRAALLEASEKPLAIVDDIDIEDPRAGEVRVPVEIARDEGEASGGGEREGERDRHGTDLPVVLPDEESRSRDREYSHNSGDDPADPHSVLSPGEC